jgi:hypothetical protein
LLEELPKMLEEERKRRKNILKEASYLPKGSSINVAITFSKADSIDVVMMCPQNPLSLGIKDSDKANADLVIPRMKWMSYRFLPSILLSKKHP